VIATYYISANTYVTTCRGIYRGGSGRNLRPVWLKREKNSTLKGGRIPPDIWVILMTVLLVAATAFPGL